MLSEKIGRGPTRQCDARCYDAKTAHCDCICGGKNHGAGKQQAMENVQKIFLPKIEAATGGMELGKLMRRDARQMEFPT